jgi:hypothetical protein
MVVALQQLDPLHQRLPERSRPANKMMIPIPKQANQRGLQLQTFLRYGANQEILNF